MSDDSTRGRDPARTYANEAIEVRGRVRIADEHSVVLGAAPFTLVR